MTILINAIDWIEKNEQEFIDITMPLDLYPKLGSMFEEAASVENAVELSMDLSGAKDNTWDLKIGGIDLIQVDPNYDYCVVDNNLIIYIHSISFEKCLFLIKKLREQEVEFVSYSKQ